jgi:hypothetical protein
VYDESLYPSGSTDTFARPDKHPDSVRRAYRVRPEMELLLLCIQPELCHDQKRRIGDLTSGPLDWDAFLELACWHTLGPFVHSISSTLSGACPPEIVTILREMFTANSLRNLFLTGELARLISRFEELKIPVIAYKGPLLAGYYETPGARQFQDLDLLIHKRDLSQVHRMLEQIGLRASEERLAFARAFDFELTYESEEQALSVDLHWSLMPRFYALPEEAEWVWDRCVAKSWAGRTIRTLRCDDSVLFLCAHGTKHIWESLGWVCDLALVLRAHPELDWEALFPRAAQQGLTRALSLGLFLAMDLLDARIPEPYSLRISADRKVRHLAGLVYGQLFEERSSHWGAFASCRFLMSSRDNFRDALRCGAERVFQPTTAEWRSFRLPRSLFALYYPVRIFRLLTKHVV